MSLSRMITCRWMIAIAIPGIVVDYAQFAGRSLQMRQQAAIHTKARLEAEVSRDQSERTFRAGLGRGFREPRTAAEVDRIIASEKASAALLLPRLRRLLKVQPGGCFTESFWFELSWGEANECAIYHEAMERKYARAARYPWLPTPSERE